MSAEKQARLYTPKTSDKREIQFNIPEFLKQSVWIGLSDIVQEGVFVWEDDGSVVTSTWRKVLFCPGKTFYILIFTVSKVLFCRVECFICNHLLGVKFCFLNGKFSKFHIHIEESCFVKFTSNGGKSG